MPPSFGAFVRRVNPTLLSYEHVPRLVGVAERIVAGELKRVLVLMPPRYFKSEVFSRLLPAYFLLRHARLNCGLVSYGAGLAWNLSEDARNYFYEAGGLTRHETDAKKEWRTVEGGRMWADGIGGPLTGKGYHLGIIDDPMKPQHARSQKMVETFQQWFPGTWYNRQEPGAAMLVVMQRLGPADPIDFLLRREVGDRTEEAPEHWHVVCCDEVRSAEPLARYDGPQGLPATCTLEPDPRPTGQVLAPSRFGEAEVERQQRAAGVHCAPQRQQRATLASGDVWRAAWFETYGTPGGDPAEELPDGCMNGGWDWDTAYTKDESNAATAGIESYMLPAKARGADENAVYITRCDWMWVESPEAVAWLKRLGGPHHIEAKASGKSIRQHLEREGVPATEVAVTGGDKYARTTGVQPIVGHPEHGGTRRVFVHASAREKLLQGDRQGLCHVTYEQLRDGSSNLDLNDAFVQLLNRHTRPQLDHSRI